MGSICRKEELRLQRKKRREKNGVAKKRRREKNNADMKNFLFLCYTYPPNQLYF